MQADFSLRTSKQKTCFSVCVVLARKTLLLCVVGVSISHRKQEAGSRRKVSFSMKKRGDGGDGLALCDDTEGVLAQSQKG